MATKTETRVQVKVICDLLSKQTQGVKNGIISLT